MSTQSIVCMSKKIRRWALFVVVVVLLVISFCRNKPHAHNGTRGNQALRSPVQGWSVCVFVRAWCLLVEEENYSCQLQLHIDWVRTAGRHATTQKRRGGGKHTHNSLLFDYTRKQKHKEKKKKEKQIGRDDIVRRIAASSKASRSAKYTPKKKRIYITQQRRESRARKIRKIIKGRNHWAIRENGKVFETQFPAKEGGPFYG